MVGCDTPQWRKGNAPQVASVGNEKDVASVSLVWGCGVPVRGCGYVGLFRVVDIGLQRLTLSVVVWLRCALALGRPESLARSSDSEHRSLFSN